MQESVIVNSDSTSLQVDTAAAASGFPYKEFQEIHKASDYFSFDPFAKADTSSTSLFPTLVSPVRYSGTPRPSTYISETILILILFLASFLFLKFFRSETQAISNFFSQTKKENEKGKYFAIRKQFTPFFWMLDVAIISYAIMHFFIGYKPGASSNEMFWRIVAFVASFLLLKIVLYRLTGAVFFGRGKSKSWIMGNHVIFNVFSFSVVPVLALSVSGILIPKYVIIAWPIAFWALPKLVYCLGNISNFSGYRNTILHFILYLCALEILPILLFVKGIFLL